MGIVAASGQARRRIAIEKNVEAFLEPDINAEQVMVGDGPQRAELQARLPDARWLGYRREQALIDEYAAADAFVFPSRTDTFGLVMLEALASGWPSIAKTLADNLVIVDRRGSGGR